MTAPPAETLGLRELNPSIGYDTADQALREFYIPALSRAVRYDRSVGYFRASALSVAAKGMSRFIAGGGTARLLVGAEVGEQDRDALVGATEIPPEFAARLASDLVPEDEIARRRLEVLGWLVIEKRLEIRVAVAIDPSGRPVAPGQEVPYFHEKLGVLVDHRDDGVAFQGSVNETATGWASNFESFSVYRSWDATAPYYDHWVTKFNQRWSGEVPGFRVFPLPEAVEQALVNYAPAEAPPARDPEEGPELADRATIARFLQIAPRLLDTEALAEATSAVTLFPHQRKVVERLAGTYPRSWLCADEVGLGKTISAGCALRRLLLTGEVQRALVLAPANVCRQWQDEMFERFGLWIPRLDGNRIHGAHPDDVRQLASGENPYETEPILLVSSHLARSTTHRERILTAPPLDLLIVDEAHHARRRAADVDEYRPSRLLQLLDEVATNGHASAVWMLTATPMQLHVIELIDLLRQVGLDGPLEHHTHFGRFYSELAKPNDDDVDWAFLARMISTTGSASFDPTDNAVLARTRVRNGLLAEEVLRRFGRPGEDSQALVNQLSPSARGDLRSWIRHRGPVGQLVTRHSRVTLKRYRDQGLLSEPLADRDVQAVPIPFTPQESELYERLDGLLDRLMQAHGTRRGAGFVLTIYRRRLTSSWAAIRRSLQRRLARQGVPLELELDLLDEIEAEEITGDGTSGVDDSQAVPLTDADLEEIREYLDDLDRVPDSKFDRLRSDIDEARDTGRAVLVFTQFTDTLEYLRDRLRPIYRSHLATYTGAGGQQWYEDEGWVNVSKQQLVEALRSGRISVLLATDAASEGLNLQAASYLISYDTPWTPARMEQRIGRCDRLGQHSPTVTIRNYFVPGTVEESVYQALADRIDLFAGIVGQLQPILGATEAAFRRIFRAPRSERHQIEEQAIADLLAQVDQLQDSGLDLGDEDPLPLPEYSAPPVTLAGIHRALIEDLDVVLDTTGRPATTDPSRVSRDRERWTALATYGHPRLEPALREITPASADNGALVIGTSGARAVAYRADRSPPERVRTVDQLLDLGGPVSSGEAEEASRRDLDEADAATKERVGTLTAARAERWKRRIRQQFRTLVIQTVRAEQLLRRLRDGEAPDPGLVWLDLTQDTMSGWSHADLFRQHLDLDLADLLPRGRPGPDDRGERALRRVRSDTGQALVQLIVEFRDTALSVPEQVG